jgi:hypothetical protein
MTIIRYSKFADFNFEEYSYIVANKRSFNKIHYCLILNRLNVTLSPHVSVCHELASISVSTVSFQWLFYISTQNCNFFLHPTYAMLQLKICIDLVGI